MEITRGPKNYDKLKQDLIAAGYKGEKVVILAASTIPTIWAEAQVASDTLKKIGMNTDFQALEWGTVVQRRASQEPNDKGGWNIFYTFLGGFGNISPAPDIAYPEQWNEWKLVRVADRSEDGGVARRPGSMRPMLPRRRRLPSKCRWSSGKARPMCRLGMYDQPTAFHNYLTDIRDGWPQFYGVKKNA